MKITFHPTRSDQTLSLRREGDCLWVQDQCFDFSALPDGAILPQEAMDSAVFCGPVTRQSGLLHLNLLLPYGAGAVQGARFPDPIDVLEDGPVLLPHTQEGPRDDH